MENQEVQHLQINIPEWLANSNDPIVIICSDNDGSADSENQNEIQQELVVPINAILDESEQNQVMVQMPVESSPIPAMPPPFPNELNQVVVQLPVEPVCSTDTAASPPKKNRAEVQLPAEMSSSASTAVVAQEEQAPVRSVKVVITEADSDCDQDSSPVPVAIFENDHKDTGVVVDGSGDRADNKQPTDQSDISVEPNLKPSNGKQSDVANENDSGIADHDRAQSEKSAKLKEHDYPTEKHRKALQTASVSRRSKRKAAMSPRRRWCHAGCCEDGKQHGKSQESPVETARTEKSPKHMKSVDDQGPSKDEPNDKDAYEIKQRIEKQKSTRSSQKRKGDPDRLPKGKTPVAKKKTQEQIISDGRNDEEADTADVKAEENASTTKALRKKKRAAKKREMDSLTITPDGVSPDDGPVPINVFKATKPKDIDGIIDQDSVQVNTRFECVCGQKFTQKKSLIRHFRRKKFNPDGNEGGESEHYSKYPIAIYPNTKAPRKKPPQVAFPCPYCPKVLQTKGGIDYHLMSHTGHKPVLCSLCGESFKSKQILDQHFVIHNQSNELPHKCDHCGRTYLTASRLRAHQKIHGEKTFSCEFCNRGFVMMKDLKKHMRVHTGEKPFQCEFCEERFHFSQDVKRHLKRFHTDKAPYHCSICPKNNYFFKTEEFELHRRFHEDDVDFRCEICSQNFTSYTTLRNHQMTHSDKNPFTCRYELCGLIFKSANDRYLHERRFHDTNLLHCQFCRLTFKRQSALEDHAKKHLEASYTCRVDPGCGMKFTEPHLRLRHERSHSKEPTVKSSSTKSKKRANKDKSIPQEIPSTPETIYQCGVCWKTYKNYPSLRDHVRDHGEEMPYECRVAGCGQKFKRVYHRRKHEQTHSTDEIINSVLDSRLRANEESIDSSEEEVNRNQASSQGAEAVDPNANAASNDLEETEIAVQFVLH